MLAAHRDRPPRCTIPNVITRHSTVHAPQNGNSNIQGRRAPVFVLGRGNWRSAKNRPRNRERNGKLASEKSSAQLLNHIRDDNYKAVWTFRSQTGNAASLDLPSGELERPFAVKELYYCGANLKSWRTDSPALHSGAWRVGGRSRANGARTRTTTRLDVGRQPRASPGGAPSRPYCMRSSAIAFVRSRLLAFVHGASQGTRTRKTSVRPLGSRPSA